jgi:hypothetical protein
MTFLKGSGFSGRSMEGRFVLYSITLALIIGGQAWSCWFSSMCLNGGDTIEPDTFNAPQGKTYTPSRSHGKPLRETDDDVKGYVACRTPLYQ